MGPHIRHARSEWDHGRKEYWMRMDKARPLTEGGNSKIVDPSRTIALLEAIIQPADRVALEGNNQKQSDFLADCLCRGDPYFSRALQSVLPGSHPSSGVGGRCLVGQNGQSLSSRPNRWRIW